MLLRLELLFTNSQSYSSSTAFIYLSSIHRQLISKVRTVLEAQSPRHKSRVAQSSPATTGHTERITTRTNARQFESFLRSIGSTSSLLDARRLKNDIVGEIRRTRLLLCV